MKNSTRLTLVVTILTLLAASSAFAGSPKTVPGPLPSGNLLSNGSFEMQSFAMGDFSLNDVTGWDVMQGSSLGVGHAPPFYINTSYMDGVNDFWIVSGGVSQAVNAVYQPHTDYTFSITVLYRSDFTQRYPVTLQFMNHEAVVAECAPAAQTDPASLSADDVEALTFSTGSAANLVGQPIQVRIVASRGFDWHYEAYADSAMLTAAPSQATTTKPTVVCSQFLQ